MLGYFCNSRNQRKNSYRSFKNRLKIRNEIAVDSILCKNTITLNHAFPNQCKKYSFSRNNHIQSYRLLKIKIRLPNGKGCDCKHKEPFEKELIQAIKWLNKKIDVQETYIEEQ